MRGTMLDVAKRDIKSAKVLFGEADDGQLQNAAYFAQQAVEKVIKYIYECHGFRYPFGHDISTLLSTLPKEQTCFDASLLDELLMRADTYTAWEQKTRYPNDYMVARRQVEMHLRFVEKLITLADSYMQLGLASGSNSVNTVKKMNLFKRTSKGP